MNCIIHQVLFGDEMKGIENGIACSKYGGK